MKINLVAGLAGAIFLATGLGFAAVSLNRIVSLQRKQASLDRKENAITGKLEQLRREITAGRTECQDRQAELARLQAEARAAKASRPLFENFRAQTNAMRALMIKQPKLLDLYLRSSLANLAERAGPFYRIAGLLPDQIEKFEQLITDHEESKVDLMATAADRSLTLNDPAVAAINREQGDETRQREKNVLGEAGYQQLQQYYRAQPAEGFIYGAAAHAVDTVPYSSAQRIQLLQLLANASANYRDGREYDPGSVDWIDATAQAAAILSPAQLDAFKIQVQLQANFVNLGKLQADYFSRP